MGAFGFDHRNFVQKKRLEYVGVNQFQLPRERKSGAEL